LEYEASTDYLDDQAYWAGNLPPESELQYRSVREAGGRDPHEYCAPVQLDPSAVAGIDELARALGMRRSSVILRRVRCWWVVVALRVRKSCSIFR
jgi:hypothetical protein